LHAWLILYEWIFFAYRVHELPGGLLFLLDGLNELRTLPGGGIRLGGRAVVGSMQRRLRREYLREGWFSYLHKLPSRNLFKHGGIRRFI